MQEQAQELMFSPLPSTPVTPLLHQSLPPMNVVCSPWPPLQLQSPLPMSPFLVDPVSNPVPVTSSGLQTFSPSPNASPFSPSSTSDSEEKGEEKDDDADIDWTDRTFPLTPVVATTTLQEPASRQPGSSRKEERGRGKGQSRSRTRDRVKKKETDRKRRGNMAKVVTEMRETFGLGPKTTQANTLDLALKVLQAFQKQDSQIWMKLVKTQKEKSGNFQDQQDDQEDQVL